MNNQNDVDEIYIPRTQTINGELLKIIIRDSTAANEIISPNNEFIIEII